MESKFTVSERLSGVGEYYFSKKNREIADMRAAGTEVINLGIGSPDLPPHKSVVETLAAEASKSTTHVYAPYNGAAVLRNAFADWYGRHYGVKLDPNGEVLPLIGSKEGIMHVCMTYLNKGDKALIPNPGYPTYRSAVTIAGGVCVEYKLLPENNWLPDFEQMERDGVEGVKLMLVNYPNMPTGAKAPKDMFAKLVAFAKKHGILLVHDNPYSFIRNSRPESLMAVEGAMDTALELNSLSKSHNMAGWRIGVVVGKKERLSEIMRFKSNMDSGMFLPMQSAGAVALGLGDDWYAQLNATYREREKAGKELLDVLGCKYDEEQAGLFLWARLPEGFEGNCYDFSDKYLYNAGVFLTPGAIFGSVGERYIRICLCAPVETLRRAKEKVMAVK